jgi:hypothetical protein
MKPVTMEDLVGTKALVSLHPEAFEILDVQGIDDPQFVARVLGFDSFGLWVENPRYCTTPVYDDEGAYIEPEDRGEVCHRAVVLLQWPFIKTILQFPDRPTFGTSLNASEIGFKLAVPIVPAPAAGTGKRRLAVAKAAAGTGSAAAGAKSKSKGGKRA